MTHEESKFPYEILLNKYIELLAKVANLEEQLEKAKKMLFGKRSEKSKNIFNDRQLMFDGFQKLYDTSSDTEEIEDSAEESAPKKSKKTGEHRGRNELRGDLEIEEVLWTLPEDQQICQVCGDKLVPFAKKHITTRIKIIPERIFQVRYFRQLYKCVNCDKNGIKSNIQKAPDLTPAPVIQKGLPEAEMIAYVADSKFTLGEPLYRMEQHFKMQGLYLSRTTMANWLIKSSKWLKPVISRFWEYAYSEPVLNADETTFRVLNIDGKPIDKMGQMWVVCTGKVAERKIALYTYRNNRTKSTAEELLGNYTGIVQTDGYQGYGSGKYRHAGCWAHARRKFVDSIPPGDVTESKAAIAVKLLDQVAALEGMARKEHYSSEQLLELRQKAEKPILEKFYDFISELRPSKGSHLGTAIRYAKKQKEKLMMFLEYPEVEMTNNLAERTVKPFVIDRKNFLFSASDKGAEATARFMSLIETAKRNGLNIFGYLTHLMKTLPAWGENPTEEQIDSIMPWSTELPKSCFKIYHQIVENEIG